MIPAQVVVTGELEKGKHRSLKILTRNAREEDIRGFFEDVEKLAGKGERENVNAVAAGINQNAFISTTHGRIQTSIVICETLY